MQLSIEDQYNIMKEMREQNPFIGWHVRLRVLGIRDGEFCDMNGVNRTSFSRWINGKVFPDLESFVKVQRAIERLESNAKN